MSEQRAIVIPDSVDVETSTEHGFVILKVEVLLEGERSGDRSAFQHYQLNPYDAISLGRRLQDQSVGLLLSLAGYAVPPDKFL